MRLSSTTTALCTLLALLLLAPTAASAQGGDAAQGDAVDGAEGDQVEPAEPPPTPRKLQQALKQLKKKEWPLASMSLYAVIEDPEAAYFHQDVRYYLALALEQMGLSFSALEEYNRFLVGIEPDSKLLNKGIERSVNLARQMDAGWIIAPGLSRLDTSAVSAGLRGPAMYWVGKHHFEDGRLAASRAYLSLVPKDTEYYARARMVEGVVMTVDGQPVQAIAPLAAALASAREGAVDDNTWEIANLNLARAYYAIGNFERAIEHFEKTPRNSPLWFESLYEASWAYFRLGRLSGALSHLQSVDSPFFDGTYHPDATLLRILLFYYLCKYISGQEMLKEFTEEHYPIAKELEAAIAAAERDPDALFDSLYAWKTARKDAGVSLPDPVKQVFATDESLVRIGDYLKGIDTELAAIDRQKTGWERSSLRADLEKVLKKRKRDATSSKGKQALAKLQGMYTELGAHLGNSELYKVELITAEKDIYDAAYRGQLVDKIAARKLDLNVPEGYQFWPFEGEYWIDELGWYEVNTVNECLEIQR